ncbi:MAG TPA: cation:dicarboxylase symporter family transporter [Rhodanobacter sp.]|nr:cation:dicarboxylase symporter family transporter [Rhodanobacter sp.]
MSAAARVLTGPATGALIGLLRAGWNPPLALQVSNVALPTGKLWPNALQMMVVHAMGLPLSPLGLMLAVDTLPDAPATLGNVTADLTATRVVTRQSRRDTA